MGNINVNASGAATVRNRWHWEALGDPDIGLTLYWADRGPGNDAYTHPISVKVRAGELRDTIGIVSQVGLRSSLQDNTVATNKNNSYTRKAYVGLSTGNTPEIRLRTARALRDICMLPENNTYGSAFSADASDDHTVIPQRSPDHLMTNMVIVDLVYNIYDDVNTEWYNDYKAVAQTLFSSLIQYPECAIARLGFPAVSAFAFEEDDSD